jgi:hypothetical protein
MEGEMYGRPKPKPPARVPPGAAVTAAEFAELPFGGHAGEWLSGGQAAPAPMPPQPLVIEPPPWATDETGPVVPLAAPASVSGAQPTALEAMRAEDGETSWPEPGPPVVLEPLIRPLPPPPDWRAEEAERERLRAAEAQEKLEPARDPYPARPARGEARTVARMNTVYGRLADPLGHAATGGRGWASPAAAYLREQNPEIRVDVDHSHAWCGSILFLARHAGNLWADGEVDDSVSESVRVRVGSQTVEVPTKLYWSASRIGSPDDGLLLTSVSLTPSPASVDPRPVTFLEGRLDHRQAAQRWRSRLDRAEFSLLERAANARADRRRGDAILIDELGDPKAVKLARDNLWIDERTGEPIGTTSFRSAPSRSTGGLRYSAPARGSVLRVC